MTLIAAPIFVTTVDAVPDALDRARRAVSDGASLIEWRVDLLAGESNGGPALERLVRDAPAPCIITCRPTREGGSFDGSDADRLSLLSGALEQDHRPRYVDVELTSLDGAGDLLASLAPEGETGLILSSHDFDGRPRDLLQRIEAMAGRPEAAVVKVAWTARSLRDNLEAFDLLAERRLPMIALCMGPFGLMSRVLAPKFGALLTFAVERADAETAPGQPTIAELRSRFRFDAIGPETRIYGVIGWPVEHSMSPDLHNAGFAHADHDGVDLPMPVPPEYEHFKATVGTLVDHPRLGFAGASVTIPHKEHLIRFIRERGGVIGPVATATAAANTLIVRDDGVIECRNTDAPAAASVLAAGLGGGPDALSGCRVLVLGAGGVARAVTVGLLDTGATVTVVNRTPDRARALVAELASRRAAEGTASALTGGASEVVEPGAYDVIVNGTPIGMSTGPAPQANPITALGLSDRVTIDADVTVFDTVYTPIRTPLIAEAEAAGARVIPGTDMFVRQAEMQFELWTGEPPPEGLFASKLTADS